MNIGDQFKEDTKDHLVDILMDNGVYKHLVCSSKNSSTHLFDIVTYPGYLFFLGDIGNWIFYRERDMFKLFRRPNGEINPEYWAEKCLVGDVKQYSADVFKREIKRYIENEFEDNPVYRYQVSSNVLELFDIADDGELIARSALDKFVCRYGSYGEMDFRFQDTFELDFQEYTDHFLWALHGIVWAINQYDNMTPP